MSTHIFGIRHHGPGSARSLQQALAILKPNVILVEGPPDAEAVLPLLTHQEMQPPVALLIYAPDEPKHAVYYPFAVFSPEWQAIHYGLTNNITVRFMDLPQSYQLAQDSSQPTPNPQPLPPDSDPRPRTPDPLSWLAQAAGYDDGERWWEHMVEQRQDSADLFAAIAEAMTELRSSVLLSADPREAQREAYMRQTIRIAQREGFERIAVVCGAWHVPALQTMPSARDDTALLKGLPKVKVSATWVPWTNSRLSMASGYGAGMESPGWYHHLWTTQEQPVIRWLAHVARLLRDADIDVSSAHVIETVRLAETLAAFRGRTLPDLSELTEATQTVICFGNPLPLQLIHDKLIVGETLGHVPDETPMVPLQQDVLREQKRLRLAAEATWRDLDLDLRKQTDLERSYLLHRLALLGIPWGERKEAQRTSGTFHELWRIQWQPEFAIRLIEAGVWGNTMRDATTTFVRQTAEQATTLPQLTNLVEPALLAHLPEALSYVMIRLQAEATVASDVANLMNALPPLANVRRYGNVRQTDVSMVGHVVSGLVARICVGLPGACASLNDEAAVAMSTGLTNVHAAISLLQSDEYTRNWHGVLSQLTDQNSLHGLLGGQCCRLLLDAQVFAADEVARRFSLALSTANDPSQAAAWIEGFLKGSGLLLLHDETLWQVLDNWVMSLSSEVFTQVLPLLRRTFSTFPAPERRQMGERVARGASLQPVHTTSSDEFDHKRAEAVLPLVAQLLGLTFAGQQ